MKVVVTGTRGIPNIQGGVETHCEELFPRMVRLNFDVHLIRRSCYIPSNDKLTEFNGVKLVTLYTVRQKSVEALFHTFVAILWAKRHKTDIIHVHAIGPALLIPFARLVGLKVVFTHHGADYNRAKWGIIAKSMLKLGERFGTLFANEVIVISDYIKQSLTNLYNRTDSNLIFNGVTKPVFTNETSYIDSLGLKSGRFVFTLGRFVEEKGFDFLIHSFCKLKHNDMQLVIAGDADHETSYSRKLKELAVSNSVILTGFIKGDKLQQLFSHARLFVLPSFHEGLPISLLEAMSYKLPVLVSDIPANKQISLPKECFFETGNEESLIKGLKMSLEQKPESVDYNMSPYNWDLIALQTAAVYDKVVKLLTE